jgi:hypothetical protein
MRRLEYKYLAKIEYIDPIREYTLNFVEPDIYMEKAGLPEYTVRSIYFDTSEFDLYNDKVEGLEIRKKIRIRGYNQPTGMDIVFLEIKRKLGDAIYKNRAPILYENLEKLLLSGDVDGLIIKNMKGFESSLNDARKFLFHIYRKNMQPIAVVIYEREAYHGKIDGNFRITFDKNLRCFPYPGLNELFIERNLTYQNADYFLIETKFFGQLPNWFKFLINKFSLMRVSFSKYVICADLLGITNKNLTFNHASGFSKYLGL